MKGKSPSLTNGVLRITHRITFVRDDRAQRTEERVSQDASQRAVRAIPTWLLRFAVEIKYRAA